MSHIPFQACIEAILEAAFPVTFPTTELAATELSPEEAAPHFTEAEKPLGSLAEHSLAYTPPLPLIISLECHCSLAQQAPPLIA